MQKAAVTRLLKNLKVKKQVFPSRIDPMLATRVEKIFDDKQWSFEVKWDGYRVVAYKRGATVTLRSRSFQNYTSNYSSIVDALKKLPFSCVLDGEVIMLGEDGKPSFDDLQRVKDLGPGRLVYCVFDLMWFEGYSLLDVPLHARQELLLSLFKNAPEHILFQEPVPGKGTVLFEEMQAKGLEGVVAKLRDSVYTPGERSTAWLKVQTRKRQEFVIGGWQESTSGRAFRSLMFGYYKNGKLEYFGHSGSGYTDKSAAELKKKLLKLEITKKPFAGEVEFSNTPHWVKPVLVGEFEYATTTRSGKIRKPAVFKGLRTDKDPKEIVLEPSTQKLPPTLSQVINADSNWPELKASLERGSKNELIVENKTLELNNVERVLWKEEGITKADLIRYYIEHAELILPYLRDRPLSLHIKHNGVGAPGMYIKGMEGQQPTWASTFVIPRKHQKAGKSEKIDYLVCQDLATLVYTVNLGCIDLNPWNSRTQQPTRPDYLVVDLDPSDDDFKKVLEVARATHRVCSKLKLKTLPKTSGKTGIHVFIPVKPVFTFPQARQIVGRICEMIHIQVQAITTLNDSVSMRHGKVFLDDNQNDLADTLASAYSVRPFHTPNVSTPVTWRELEGNVDPSSFTIREMSKRLRRKGDLFSGLFSAKNASANTTILRRLL